MVHLLSPADGSFVPLLTPGQRRIYYTQTDASSAADDDWRLPVYFGKYHDTAPVPVVLRFASDSTPSVVEIDRTPEFKSPFRIITEDKTAYFRSPRPGTRYYWRVNGEGIASFVTEDLLPHQFFVDGVCNVRDSGGYPVSGGMRIREGLIYRGSTLCCHIVITPAGVRTMLEEMGIRTDVDLRREKVGLLSESPLGKSVAYRLRPAVAYETLTENKEDGFQLFRELMETLADSSLYPIYYHCTAGADRTGTIAYLLGALLGMSEHDLVTDYELSSLALWGIRSRYSGHFTTFLRELESFAEPGASRKEQAEAFFRAAGVPDSVIDALRNNLLEPDPSGRA